MFSIKLILLCILNCTFQAAESSKTLRGSLGHYENNVLLFCADVSASQRLEYGLHNMQTYLITITHLLTNDSKGLKGVSGSILLHAVIAVVKKVKVCFYTAQYPVC